MAYLSFRADVEGKRKGKKVGRLHLVDGYWLTINEIAHRTDCSIAKTRKYIVNGVMSAKDFISLQEGK